MKKAKPTTKPAAHLFEVRMGKPGAVDRESGVIRGVKILGLESLNGRRYTVEACKEAARLYEGRRVNANHPAKPTDGRDVEDVFGWFENIVAKDDGLWGDFHILNPKTELAESLFAAAERKPDLFGFSHNAVAEGAAVEGVFVVDKIIEVRSVDLVAEPATTNGLFEGRNPMAKKKIKAALESVLPKLTTKQQPHLKRLLEDDAMLPALMPDMDVPDEEVDPNDALKDGFQAACLPLLDKALDGDMDALKQLTDFVKTHAKIAAKPDAPVEEEGDKDKKDDKDAPVAESEDKDDKSKAMEAKIIRLERTNKARELCEEAGISLAGDGKALLEALVSLDDAGMARLIAREKALAAQLKANAPRSKGPGNITESRNAPTNTNEFAAECFGRRVS